jgi:AraC-like DNA-binding protein
MLALPVSMVVSLALGFLLLRILLTGRRSWPIPALLAACAAQGVVIALAQYYGVTQARLVQPVTATLVAPLAWIAFRTTMVRAFDPWRDLPHLLVPAFTAFCAVFAPMTLDAVIPAIFLVYGLAMLHALRTGSDGLPLTRLEAGDWPQRIWAGIAASLLLSALSDGLIAVAQMSGANWLQSWIVSVVSSISLLLVGVLTLSKSLESSEDAAPSDDRTVPEADAERDAAIVSRLDRLLTDQALFLDPDLTLARLARRLGLPAKQLSSAINRIAGQNVSRHINAYRIRHACERLKAGQSVTTAMLESGFNTKSNFNREFQRVTGTSPTAWLSEGHPGVVENQTPQGIRAGLSPDWQGRYSHGA